MNNGRAKPFPYQKEGVYQIEDFNGRVLLADSAGLGKTLQSLWALKRNPSWLPALIVCPASVKYTWEHEANYQVGLKASVCEGRKPPTFNRRGFSTLTPLTIINYDILHNWESYLKKIPFNTIIGDECQNIKNSKTLRAESFKSLSKKIKHIFMLSATPLENRPIELYSTLNILWPETYKSRWAFAQRFCNPRWTPWGWDFTGAANTDKLNRELLRHGMIRRRKEDILHQLPSKIRCIVPCDLMNRSEYKRASDDFMLWLRRTKPHKIRRASKAQKLYEIGELLRLITRLKLKGVVDWANDFLSQSSEKLVLFANHRKAIDVLQRRVEFKSVTIDGSVSGRKRELVKTQFQNDPNIRLLIANTKAVGVGTDGLQKACSTAGVVELPWKPADIDQLEGRLHRLLQQNTVWINYLIAGDTLEERLCRILQEKQKVISSTLDGGPTPHDLNLYDELLKELEREA